MNHESYNPNEKVMSLSDLVSIIKKGKKQIYFGAFLVSFVILALVLIKPPKYEVEASFKERNDAKSAMSKGGITSIFLKEAKKQSEAVGLMSSHRLLGQVVQKLNLQADLKEKKVRFPRLRAAYENLLVEWAYLKKSRVPVLSDPNPILTLENLIYENEIPLNLNLHFISEREYRVVDSRGLQLGIGKLNQTFSHSNFSFIISRNSELYLTKKRFSLTFNSLYKVTKDLENNLVIEPDEDDPSLLLLTFYDSNRHKGCQVLDTLVEVYRDYLKDEQKRVTDEQIAYLERRQGQMEKKLTAKLNDYANSLKKDLSRLGFVNSEHAMEFISRIQQDYIQQLLKIDLESKRIKQVIDTGFNHLALEDKRHLPMVDSYLQKIVELKSQSDALDLFLRGQYSHTDNIESLIAENVNQIDDIKTCKKEAKSLLIQCQQGRFPKPATTLFSNQKFMAGAWYSQLESKADDQSSETYKKLKSQFEAYLTNLVHFLEVQEKTIQERLKHEQLGQVDFQGIDLKTAKELYVAYTQKLNEVETKTHQLERVIDQMNQTDFELSSLSAVLIDPVSRLMIEKASQNIIALRDERNRAEREQKRLKNELELSKAFLSMHVQQTVKLQQLQSELLRDKIKSLQLATHELIQQQISIFEKQVTESLAGRLISLNQERSLLQEQGQDLVAQSSTLPQKWVSERLIQTQLSLNGRMVEEIGKLVESKNIENNLDIVQSSLLDYPIAPILPKYPKLLIFVILGALFGSFLATVFLFAKVIRYGLVLTKETLQQKGFHVSGTLSEKAHNQDTLKDSDLSTLRRLASQIEKDKSLVLIEGTTPDYSQTLAHLLNKKGFSVLTLSLLFDRTCDQDKCPGLLQFLEDGKSEPKIMKGKSYDQVEFGGPSRFANELLETNRFKNLLERYKNDYDVVIAKSNVMPQTAEAETLISLFDQSSISLTHETLPQLEPLMQTLRRSDHTTTFIFVK